MSNKNIKSLQQLSEIFTDEFMVEGFIAKQLEANNVHCEFPAELANLDKSNFSAYEACFRKDLRSDRCLTIDCANTKDMDDAVSVEKFDGGYLLRVHIADVAAFVPFGSDLEAEASVRGSSIYLPGKTIPMLPEILTNDLCSLNPGVDHKAMTVEMLLSEAGEVVAYDVFKSLIQSRVKGVYAEVNEILNGCASAAVESKYSGVLDELFMLDELATKLNAKRLENGADAGNRATAEVTFVDGMIGLELHETGRAESLVAEAMILANTMAAEFANENGLPVVLRSQDEKGHYAKYSNGEGGHASLALNRYAHFTSPIRRFADLRFHQILSDYLSGVSAARLHERYGAGLDEACELATKGVRRAKNISHVVNKYCYCRYVGKRDDEEFEGEVVGRDGKGRWLVFLGKVGVNVIASRVANIHEGMKIAFNVGVNWKNNTMYTRNAYALAA